MNKTMTLAELMRRLGVPFDINPFVNAYLHQGRKKKRPAMMGAMPQQMPPQMPMLANLYRRP